MPNLLSSIYIYPVKSCAALALDCASVESRGLAHDRRWMIVDAQGRFLTGRQLPRLTLVRAQPQVHGLALSAPGLPQITLSEPSTAAERHTVTIWDETCSALSADASANAWISAYLEQPCRFVYMDSNCIRPTEPEFSQPDDTVSFADGYPLLLLSQAALDGLNGKLKEPVSILRFRPNLVVADTAAHAEDQWRHIRIGSVEFDVVKPCTRCVFTTVDFEQGTIAPNGEPLKTLMGYRRGPNGVTFGQNLIPRNHGLLHIGATVEILAHT